MSTKQPSASVTFVVDETSTAIALGSGDVPVLGTPKVVALCEEASVIAVKPTLAAGETTVGTEISVRHLAPSTVGSTVLAAAEITGVAGRKRVLSVTVTQDGSVVASGTHTRVVVDRTKFIAETGHA